MKQTKRIIFVFISLLIMMSILYLLNGFLTPSQRLNHWFSQNTFMGYNLRISHDGKWFDAGIGNPPINIVSLTFPYREYPYTFTGLEDEDYNIIWSSDENIAIVPQNIYISCFQKDFHILEEKDNKITERASYISEQIPDYEECCDYQWSSDNSLFGVNCHKAGTKPDDYQLQIFDLDANQVNSLSFTLSEEDKNLFPNGYIIDSYLGSKQSYIVLKDKTSHNHSRFYLVNMNEPDVFTHALDLQDSYTIFGADIYEQYLLLINSFSYFDDHDDYVLFNMNTGKIEQQGDILDGKFDMHGASGVVFSRDHQYIATRTSYYMQPKTDPQYIMLIWDWEKKTFSTSGEIDSILGWDEEKKAFTILLRHDNDNDSEYTFSWIKP